MSKNINFKKKIGFGVLVLFLLCTGFIFEAFAEEEGNINSYEYLKLKINNNITFETKKEKDYKVSFFNLESYFFPQTFDGAQYLNEYKIGKKEFNIKNNSGIYSLVFNYNKNNLLSRNIIKNEFIVQSTINKPKITNIVSFPVQNVAEENKIYLEFNELIDYDKQIMEQASSLANGESDLYIVSNKIAKWIIEDIDYDLSTLDKIPNQKASEVFQSKAGVCKEITNLYISMMRGLGVPARVVTGYAYTDSEELVEYVGSNWGGHAWAEVLIGDDWVPFDLTYNQYGYVDASHIILDKSTNIRGSSITINGSGYGFKLVPNTLTAENSFEILEKKEKIEDIGFNIEIEGPDKLAPLSYGYIKVKLENTHNYYETLFLQLSKVETVELLDPNKKMVIFKPNEKKEIYFRYKLPNMDGYLFPFLIYNKDIRKNFTVTARDEFHIIKKIALPQDIGDEKLLSNNGLIFDCNFIMDYPKNIILCSVKNPNNYEVNDLRICVNNDCKELDLKLNEEKSVQFETKNDNETIDYNYNGSKKQINILIEKPQLLYTHILNKSMLEIDYEILNFNEKTKLKIFNNNNLLQSSNLRKKKLIMPLVDKDNKIRLELVFNEVDILQKEEFNVTYINEKTEKIVNLADKSGSDNNFFQKIINWFKNLFR